MDDEVGVHLDGYSREDKIGFVFMDYQNMDNSFTLQNDKRFKKSDLMKKANLKKNLKRYREQTHRTFLEFIKDKDKYVKRITRYSTNDRKAKLAEQLSSLPSTLDSEVLFNTYYLENNINSYRNDNEHFSPFKKEIVSHLDNRFEDTEEKLLLLHLLNAYFLNKNLTAEFQTKIEEEFQKLTTIKSNKKFIEDFLTLHWFLNYTGGQGSLNQNHDYQAAKLDIMNNFPLRKWKGQLNTLYAIEDKIFLSLEEANQIDKNNKKGKQFIAPISARDNRMIVSGNYTFGSEELKEESIALNKAYNLKNGMTDEIFALRREELKQLREEFSYSKLKDLPQKEKEKLQKKRDEKNKSINDKYKAMEQLTEEERAAFKLKFDDLSRRQREWRNKNAEENKMKVLRQLEAEVKIYIKWAKSQMGG